MYLTLIVTTLLNWININTTYDSKKFNVKIIEVSKEEIQNFACKGRCPIISFYKKNEGIYITKMNFENNLCNQSILLHEIIHVLQNETTNFDEYDEKTKKHLKEMDALVNHNIFLSHHGKKILYSNGFAAKFKTDKNSKNNLYC